MWPSLRACARWLVLGVLMSAWAVAPAQARDHARDHTRPGRAGRGAGPSAKVKKARDHFQQGQRLFTVSRYREALEEFKEAFVAVEDPVFLYNIAQCHRLLGENGEAVRFYRRYAEAAPSAAERARAEKWIAELEAGGAGAPPVAAKGPATGPATVNPPAVTPSITPAPVGTVTPPPVGSSPSPVPPSASSSPAASASPTSPLPPPSLAAQAGIEPAPMAGEPAPSVSFTAPAPADPGPSRPIYKRWWFWAGVGAVVVLGGVAAASASSDQPLGCGMGINRCERL